MRVYVAEAAAVIAENQDGQIRRRLTDEHELDIYLVNDSSSHTLALEIHQLPSDVRLPEVEVGNVLDVILLEQEGILRIDLLSVDYADVFFVLIDDLIDSIISHQGLAAGSRAVMLRLRRWERLLEASSGGMSATGQKGLFGELVVLISMADVIGITRALESWQGPKGGTRDFDLGGTGIEVKTTAAKGLLTVRISSERQLEIIAVEHLFLWCVSIEKSDNGETLNAIIEKVQQLFDDDDELLRLFKEKLMCVGYHIADSNHYTTRFVIRGEFIYQILEGFPCISSMDIPNCVFDVGYSIDLEACENWRCLPDTIWKEINSD